MKKKFSFKLKTLSTYFILSIGASTILAACGVQSTPTSQQQEIDVGNRQAFATGGWLDATNNPYSLENFTKKILKNTSANQLILNQFVQQLIFNWYQKQATLKPNEMVSFTQDIPKKVKDLEKNVNEQYTKQVNDAGGISNVSSQNSFQKNVLDKNGGNEFTYKHRKITQRLYQDFKSSFGKLNTDNFSLKPDSTWENEHLKSEKTNIIFDKNQTLTVDEINKTENWNKIGFYPKLQETDNNNTVQNLNLSYAFANLNNFVYDQWLQDAKPFNIIMSLWKYDANATENNLSTVYDKSFLGSSFPTKADYKFPYYATAKDPSANTTSIKFKQFVNNLSTITPSSTTSPAFNLSKGYTDDNGTGIYADAGSIFDKLYPQFAAGAIHKFLQITTGSDVTNKENLKKDINAISEGDLKSKNLISLFLSKDKTDGQLGMDVNPKIFNSTSEYKEMNFVMDQRDVTNSPWMFLRNEAGVHAIAIDGYHYIKGSSTDGSDKTADHLKRAYEFYNFRVLQKLNATNLNIEDTTNVEPLADANNYFNQHFDALIADYYLKNINNNDSLFAGIENPMVQILNSMNKTSGQWDPITTTTDKNNDATSQFEKVLKALIQINYSEPNLKRDLNLGQKLQSKYLEYSLDFTKDASDSNKMYSDIKNGLASVIPYSIDTNFYSPASDNKNTGRYTTLSAIFDQKALNSQADLYNYSSDGSINNFKKIYGDYQTGIAKLLQDLKYGPDQNIQFLTGTKVLLSNSYLINAVIDQYIGTGGPSNNLTNMVSVNQLTDQYLKNIFDSSTNKIKADNQLGTNFESLSDSSNFLPIEQAIQNYYYSQTWLDSKNRLLYGGYQYYKNNTDTPVAGESLEDRINNYNKKQESIFDNNFYYQTNSGYSIYSTDNVNYLNFLKGLEYLTANRFENLRTYLRNAISSDAKAAFAWTVNVPKSQISTLNSDDDVKKEFNDFKVNYQNEISNPFLNNQVKLTDVNANFNNSLSFSKTSSNYKDDGSTSFDQTFKGFGGLVINNPSQTWTNPQNTGNVTKALDDFKNYSNNKQNGILFNYGETNLQNTEVALNSRQSLINFINHFNSASQVQQMANNLQQLVNTLTVDAVKNQSVTIQMGDNKTITRDLSFDERKNALLALVNNYKMPASNSVTEAVFKQIYGTDPSNNFVNLNNKYTLQTTGENYNENISEDLFKRFTGFLASATNNTENKYAFSVDNKYSKLVYIIQVNQSDFATADSFKNFLKSYLGDSTLAAWLVQLANQSFIQNLATNDANRQIVKFAVHDLRFQDALSDTYISNKNK